MSISMYNVLIAPTSCGDIYSDKSNVDPLNRKRVRTNENTGVSNFNCGGFALSTYNWVFPFVTKAVVNELVWNPERWKEGNLSKEVEEKADDFFSEMISAIMEQENISADEASTVAYDMFYNEVYSSPIAVRYATTCMLKAYSDLRVIKDLSELKDDEYGIIYAGGDEDFHFVRYDQFTNKFKHKVGGFNIEVVTHYNDAFFPLYKSERVFFAKKR